MDGKATFQGAWLYWFQKLYKGYWKSMECCKNSGNDPKEHIVEANEVLIAGQGAQHTYASYKLSRYACYLIVQNAYPSKEVVAIGQTYFAVQTRIQEIQQMDAYNRLSTEEERRIFLRNEMSKHNTYLAAAAKNAGVQDGLDYAIFQKLKNCIISLFTASFVNQKGFLYLDYY